MSRYPDQVRDEYGRPVPGASIYVYDWDEDAQQAGNLTSLTDDLGGSIGNPVISDGDGLFSFNAPDGDKLLEFHFGGQVRERDFLRLGPLLAGPPGLSNNAFATRAAMAAYAPSVGINVGDNFFLSEAGREGWFIVALASDWTAQIAADTTQGVFVQSTADATKVFRRHPGIDTWYNLKHFGVKGDGTIDGGGVVHGTDDTAAIQAAVNTVNALNGSKTLYFPAPSASFYRADGQLDFSQTTGVTLKSYVNRAEPTNATPSCAVVYTGTVTPFLKAGQSWSLTIDGPAFQVSNPAFVGDILSTDWSGVGRVTYSTRVTNSMFGGRTSAARHARSLLNLCGAVEAFVDASTFGWADRHIIGRAADSVLSYSNSVTIGALNRFSEYGIEAINVYGTTNWTIEKSVFELKYNTGGGTAGVGNGISDLWLGGGGSRIHTGLTIKNNGFWDAYLGKWIDIYGAGTLIEGNFAVVNNGGTFLNFNSGFGAKVSANRVIGAAGGTFINNSGPVMPNFVDDGSNICDGGITYNANPAGFVAADLAARDLSVRSSTALADNLGVGGFYHARKAAASSGVFGGGFYADRNDDTNWRGYGVFSYLDPVSGKECAAVTVAAATTSPTDPSQIRLLIDQDGALRPTGTALYFSATKVLGVQGAAVTDAAALTSVDATNAAAAPTQAEFNAFVAEFNKLRTDLGATRTTLNTLLARTRASTGHGLIA